MISTVRLQRTYSSKQNPKVAIPEENVEEVFKALANNPPIMKALHNVIEIFDKRKISLDREPDVATMWKIAKDKEIVQALEERAFPLFPLPNDYEN